VTSGVADEPVRVSPAGPSISTTQQPGSGTVGATTLKDSATLTGGVNPTGTITFSLYLGCGGALVDTEMATVNSGNGTYTTPTGYVPTAPGTYQWVASYGGDSNNNPVASNCGDEPVTVSPATPAINTQQQPASATVGASIADKATVSGGDNPTGTVTFNLYNNPNGTGTPLFTDTEPLVAGSATSAGYTTTATGTDYWVATYNGDSNNHSVSSGTADEPVTVTPAGPSISTQQNPASGTAPIVLKDTATLSGGVNPTGTITFKLYNNSGCTGNAVDTETATVSGNGNYPTPTGYNATGPGTYEWVASYGGDSKNSSATTKCGDEPVSVTVNVTSQITPTNTTCSQFASGTASTLGELDYQVKNNQIFQVSPGVFFYWVKVSGGGTYTIGQTKDQATAKYFTMAAGSNVYNSTCGTVNGARITYSSATGAVLVSFTGSGTFYIGIKYDASSVKGALAPNPTTVHYAFQQGSDASTNQKLNLVKK
jgi:hypothetical protein